MLPQYHNIHPNAKIAPNVKIEPFVTIEEDVEIGENTWIAPHASILNGARIGKNCKIYSGAQIASIPQDLKFQNEVTTTHIGDNTTVREFVTISRGTIDNMDTHIGSNTLLMAYSHIAHDCIIGSNCIIGNGSQIAGHVNIDDFAVLSGIVAVHQFVKIGSHVMISGGALVRKDVPPYIKAAKEPLSFVGINKIGLKRRQFDSNVISLIDRTYKTLYDPNFNVSKAIDRIKKENKLSKEVSYILSFIEKSERGIIRGSLDI